jgi:hypothetical protein
LSDEDGSFLSDIVMKIRGWIREGDRAACGAAAYEMWTERVAPNRPWDHKPILRHKPEASGKINVGWQKYGQDDYFYDIWSNIHYGYVGIAIGFSASELIGGAGLAQALCDGINDVRHMRWPTMQNHPQNGSWPSSADDIPDHISTQLGIDLYATIKPAALTTDLLLRRITPSGPINARVNRLAENNASFAEMVDSFLRTCNCRLVFQSASDRAALRCRRAAAGCVFFQ